MFKYKQTKEILRDIPKMISDCKDVKVLLFIILATPAIILIFSLIFIFNTLGFDLPEDIK